MSTDSQQTVETTTAPKPAKTTSSRKGPAIVAGVMVAIGAVMGAGAVGLTRPSVQMAPATPVAISSMQSDSVVTVKGKVAEIYGNKFVLSDSTGRALIETGRLGEGGTLVAPEENVSVQGRFENGFIHASYLIRADGKVDALAPPPPPPPHDWLHRLVPPK